MHRTLPGADAVTVESIEDRSAETRWDEGFLRLRRMRLRNTYADGTRSATYAYDFVERAALDAVAILLHAQVSGETFVCLRASLRPPLAFRGSAAIPVADTDRNPVLWEIPAGLIEPEEKGEAGVLACAARETLEETGFALAPVDFARLGPAVTLSPGVIGEKIHYLVAAVDVDARGVPTEDGSAVEARAAVCFVPLDEALRAAGAGRIGDAKTELGLFRLRQHLAAGER